MGKNIIRKTHYAASCVVRFYNAGVVRFYNTGVVNHGRRIGSRYVTKIFNIFFFVNLK
jgi:hypothetical protein